MQLPSKSSSHPPRPSDLSHGFPWDVSIMRRDGGLALLLMADGWPSERTSHLHDERVGRMIEGDVQGPSLFNATGTTFIITCQQPSFATRESSSGFHAHWQEVPMTNRLQGCREHESGHSKEWHHLKGFFVFVICFAVFFFPSISMNLLDVLQKNEECTQQLCAPLHTCSSWSPVDHD